MPLSVPLNALVISGAMSAMANVHDTVPELVTLAISVDDCLITKMQFDGVVALIVIDAAVPAVIEAGKVNVGGRKYIVTEEYRVVVSAVPAYLTTSTKQIILLVAVVLSERSAGTNCAYVIVSVCAPVCV